MNVMELFERLGNGDTLTPEEQAYIEGFDGMSELQEKYKDYVSPEEHLKIKGQLASLTRAYQDNQKEQVKETIDIEGYTLSSVVDELQKGGKTSLESMKDVVRWEKLKIKEGVKSVMTPEKVEMLEDLALTAKNDTELKILIEKLPKN